MKLFTKCLTVMLMGLSVSAELRAMSFEQDHEFHEKLSVDQLNEMMLMDAASGRLESGGMGGKGLLKYYLNQGADINAKTSSFMSDGETGLMIGVRSGTHVLSAFLENGADPNVKDSSGETALMRAAKTGNDFAVELLLQYGANIHLKNNKGKTAFAMAKNHPSIQKLLQESKQIKKDASSVKSCIIS